jgi:hypothetical protein
MRKFTPTLAILITFFSVFSGKGWVPFSSNQTETPVIVIGQSNRASLVADIAIKAMYSRQLSRNGITFTGTTQTNLISKLIIF